MKNERGFTGDYTIVKDYVRAATLRGQEVFVSLVHPAGEAQVDFSEALVVIAGVQHKAHYLAMDRPHSDDCFVVAFPAETTEAFLEGHVRAFAIQRPSASPAGKDLYFSASDRSSATRSASL